VRNPSGYVFLVFEEEAQVEKLLMQCHTEDGHYYLLVSSQTVPISR
jgi:RNA recognition motif